MTRVQIDRQTVFVNPDEKTVAGIISAVEAVLAADGRVLTAARLRGVELSSADAGRAVGPSDLIEVDSSTPAGLALDGVRVAAGALETIEAAAQHTAARFRRSADAGAYRDLADLAATLASALALAAAADAAHPAAGPDGARQLAACSAQLAAGLECLIEPGHFQDGEAVADALEFDLVPALEAWRRVCGSWLAAA